MPLKNLLKPKKEKIIFDLLFTLILVVLSLSIPSLGYQKQFLNLGLARQIFGIIISILFGLVIYYPLACGIVSIYNRIVKKGKNYGKKDLIFAVLFVLLFNPITHTLVIQRIMYVNYNIINQPCGIEITGFAENSLAKDVGIGIGETIINVNNQKIDTTDSFTHAMADKKPGDYVSLITNLKKYNVQTIANPNNPISAFLGIQIKQKYCKK